MMPLLHNFFLAFIPLFVAFDVLAIAPLFVSLTEGMTDKVKNQLITQATITAFGIAFAFMMVGKLLFSFLGITEYDFRIAGGIVLVVLAITDLLFSQEESRRTPSTSIGVVPLGTPLIMGPAAMTTILILLDSFGYVMTVASLVTNLFICWVSFRYSSAVAKFLGPGGSKAIAKIASLFLAAIGIMMIRVGVLAIAKSY